MLKQPHERVYSIVRSTAPNASLWYDASFHEVHGVPEMKLCCIYADEHFVEGRVSFVPIEHVALVKERDSQIALGELFAFMLSCRCNVDRLANNSVCAYIDNMGVLHSIVNGTSKSRDKGSLVHCLVLRALEIQVQLWIEHVQSASNVTDGGSRVGITCEVAASLGICS